ncbi:carbonic anhydrase [Pseudomonas asplenii]|uniref:Carbonic anhydrase n=1 Tax=Pseudomonas asplenii TaxID=53407 RepID=A0A1H1ZCA4_9PSED|nr:carbonic anhydrase [Pseudomonas asplenii]SEI18207.1 carbonic anhydrase [Pseudomonas fuscovaginae]
MKDIIESFLKCQRDAFPQRINLFRDLTDHPDARAASH